MVELCTKKISRKLKPFFVAWTNKEVRGRPYMTSDDFAIFWPPSPLIRCFISDPLVIKSDLAEPLLPPYHLTSYMDEPLPQAGHKWGFSFIWTDATWIRTDLLSIKDFWQIWQETGRSFRHVNWTCFFRLSSDFMVLWHRSQANADWFCL